MNRTGKTPNRARLWLTGMLALCGCAAVFAQPGRFGSYDIPQPPRAGIGAGSGDSGAAIQRLRQGAGVARTKGLGAAGGGRYTVPNIDNDDEGARKTPVRGRQEVLMPVQSDPNFGGNGPVIPVGNDTEKEWKKSAVLRNARDICNDAAAAYIPVRDKSAPPQQDAYFAACLEERLPINLTDVAKVSVELRDQLPSNLADVAKASVGLSTKGSTTVFCSGVLVEPGVLVTAKHCFFDPDIPHQAHENWDRLKNGEVELVSDLGRLAVICRQAGDAGVEAAVIGCTHKQYVAFDLEEDWVVLHVPKLAAMGFKGLKKAPAAPKAGTDLLLYVHFDATSKRRFTKAGCSVRETAGSCVVHDCQADHGSSGGGLLFKGPDGQLLAGGIHLAGATNTSQCGFGAMVTSRNVGIVLP